MADLDIDGIFGAATGDVDWPALGRVRDACPVAHLSDGLLMLTRHGDVSDGFRSAGAAGGFSHEGGMRPPGVKVHDDERLMSEMDGPWHAAIRKLVMTALHPRLVNAAEPFVRRTAGELLDALVDAGGGDVVADFAVPIPSQVLAHLVGLPRADYPRFKAWSDRVVWDVKAAPAPRPDGYLPRFEESHPEFAAYLDDAMDDRQRHPRDDLVSRLLSAEADGVRLSRRQIRVLVMHLVIAGNETTAHLIANLLGRLIADPALYRAVRADRSLLAAAVEESLRLDPPVLGRPLMCTRPRKLHGQELRPGTRVMMAIAGANRDGRAFADPDRFRLDRPASPQHVAFGGGPHFCPGAQLARLEARVAVDVFCDRVSSARVAPGWKRQKVAVLWANGPEDLPVSLLGGAPDGAGGGEG
ncbi:MAG TPA: cytochrome P450 [Acidimicrobiales bacterium]|nr:cytochrome P450 [Acidimicrobiales bacterium]